MTLIQAILNDTAAIRASLRRIAEMRETSRHLEAGRSLSVAITEVETGMLWLDRAVEQIAVAEAEPVAG